MFQGLFSDVFAGGVGASTGIARAIGRDVDIAINHDPCAIAVHRANHPTTEHHLQDIRMVWPLAATRLRPVSGAWFSPDCKEHSKAKGGPVKDRNIRQLAWEIVPWLEETRPTVAYVENVEEFRNWGPLAQDDEGRWHIIPEAKGKEFDKWVRSIRRLGYRVAWKELRACDYGAPTIRKRLYIVMRNDKQPIVWPKRTHAPANDPDVAAGKLLAYRTVAECIDWDKPVRSIFDRDRDLKEPTLRRIAHGVMRYVVNAKRPFIIPVTHSKNPSRTHDIDAPLRTVTTANGGEFALVDAVLAPHVTKFRSGSIGSDMQDPAPTVTANGEPQRPAGATPLGMAGAVLAPLIDRQFGKSRGARADEPLGAVTAGGGGKSAAVAAFLSRFHKSNTNGGSGQLEAPLGAVTAGGQHHAVVAAHMEQANTGMVGHDIRKPISTIVGTGSTQRLIETTMLPADALPPEMMHRATRCAAFLVKYYGSAIGHPVDEPFHTVTTLPRYAVVTVTIDAVTYVIVDIGMRMLTPRELARAQGFPDSYVLDPVTPRMVRGKIVHKPLTIAAQIRMIGNSVCPDVAEALVRANQPGIEMRLAA